MKTRKSRLFGLVMAYILIAFMACSSEETVTPDLPGPSAAGIVKAGWAQFEQGEFTKALDLFDQALAIDSDSFEAHSGRGWSLLESSVSYATLTDAMTAFDQALLLDVDNNDALGGRAATRLGIGGAEISGASEDAGLVLQQDPHYEFQHERTFNHSALRIIQAQAQVALEDFDSALLALDTIFISDINPGDSHTWVVEGLIQSSFGAAVIAHLDRVQSLWFRGDL